VTFEIFRAFPPDREGAVAELTVRHDGVVDIPAEIYQENGELKITLFEREGGPAWVYPLDEWVEAVQPPSAGRSVVAQNGPNRLPRSA
jgi:hypothetical protein